MNKLEIAAAFDARRKELGLTKKDLALDAEVDVCKLSDITKYPDKTSYRIETLLKLLDAVGLEIVFKVKNDADISS